MAVAFWFAEGLQFMCNILTFKTLSTSDLKSHPQKGMAFSNESLPSFTARYVQAHPRQIGAFLFEFQALTSSTKPTVTSIQARCKPDYHRVYIGFTSGLDRSWQRSRAGGVPGGQELRKARMKESPDSNSTGD